MKTTSKFSFFQFVIILTLLTVAGSVFYYYVIYLPGKDKFRQTQFSNCDGEAKSEAQKLLRDKIGMAESLGQTTENYYKMWKQAQSHGLYLRDDYNAKYESCIRRYGIKY